MPTPTHGRPARTPAAPLGRHSDLRRTLQNGYLQVDLLLGHRLRERLRGHCVIVIAVLALRPDLRRELLLAHLGHAAQAGALHGFVLDRQLLVAPLLLLVAHAHAEGDERHNDADGGGNHDDLLVGRLFGFQPAVGGVDEKH
eukprot:scaffold62701_cov40-Phaeocystis_antarctica.AAC.1